MLNNKEKEDCNNATSSNIDVTISTRDVQELKTVLDELLDEAKEFIAFSSPDEIYNTLGDYWLDFMQQRIDLCQAELTPYERVIKFTLLPETFNIDNKTLTSTLKIRRKAIAEQYEDVIEKMYLSL